MDGRSPDTDPRTSAGEPAERHAVRALLLCPEPAVLLMKLALPEPRREIWIAPGGGLEAGEAAEDCLRRELREETGLTDFALGPLIWTRSHTFRLSQRAITQHERFWLVPTERFEPDPERMPAGPERDWFLGYRWWPLADLLATQEILVPMRMGALLQQLLEAGPPPTPIDVGV